ncbi:MAG TPA: hypothetical protein VMT11_01685 [Myxococcaceae bacterium]|nr:hypothetical protein [Myxococcaceae bacterium]
MSTSPGIPVQRAAAAGVAATVVERLRVRVTAWAGPLTLLGAWAVFFAPQLVSSGVPFYRDHLVTNIPLRAYVRERLLSGQLPQWYPYESLGVPVIGQIALATFHPFTFLFLPLQPAAAEKASILGAFLLALLGAYALCRALGAGRLAAIVGAMAYGFGGYLQGVSSILAYTLSASALPWMATGAVKVVTRGRWRDASMLGVSWGLVFLSGDAVSFLFSGLLVLLLLFARPSPRGVLLSAAGGVVAALLTGIELLPSTVVAADSVRAMGAPSALLNLRWALHPLRLPELLVPGYLPDGARSRVVADLFHDGTATFSTSLFAGAVVLALAAGALPAMPRLGRAFLGMGALGAWLSLGEHGRLLPLLQRLLPLLSRFRYPERYLVWTWLALAVAAALGAERARRLPARWAKALLVAGLAGAVLTAVASNVSVAGLLWRWQGHPLVEGDRLRETVDLAWSLGLAWSAGSVLAAGALLRAAGRRPGLIHALPLLVLVELWHGNGGHFPLADPRLVGASNPFVEAIRRESPGLPRVFHAGDPGFRVSLSGPERQGWIRGMQHLLRSDVAGLYGISSLDSNLGALSVRHALLLGSPARQAELAPLLGVPFRIDVGSPPSGARVLAREPELGLTLSRAETRPRAFLSATVAALSRAEAERWVGEHGSPGRSLVWEGGPSLPMASGEVTWLEDAPERSVLRTRTDGPTALVLADEWAPGWTAAVDGVPAPVRPTLLTLRGVDLPPGEHSVRFEYRTPRLVPGALATLGGLLLALALLALERQRRGAVPVPA